MGFEVIPFILGSLRPLPHSLARGHYEQRQVVPLSVARRKHVVAQTQKVSRLLSLEAKRVQRFLSAALEQMQRVSFRLAFKKAPHRAYFHELRRLVLHLFHAFEQLDRLRIAFRKALLKITAESHVPSIE